KSRSSRPPRARTRMHAMPDKRHDRSTIERASRVRAAVTDLVESALVDGKLTCSEVLIGLSWAYVGTVRGVLEKDVEKSTPADVEKATQACVDLSTMNHEHIMQIVETIR